MKKPKCPKCGSVNTVGEVSCCSTSKANYTKKGYFCYQCLVEFDDKVIRVYSSQGNWLRNIAIN